MLCTVCYGYASQIIFVYMTHQRDAEQKREDTIGHYRSVHDWKTLIHPSHCQLSRVERVFPNSLICHAMGRKNSWLIQDFVIVSFILMLTILTNLSRVRVKKNRVLHSVMSSCSTSSAREDDEVTAADLRSTTACNFIDIPRGHIGIQYAPLRCLLWSHRRRATWRDTSESVVIPHLTKCSDTLRFLFNFFHFERSDDETILLDLVLSIFRDSSFSIDTYFRIDVVCVDVSEDNCSVIRQWMDSSKNRIKRER